MEKGREGQGGGETGRERQGRERSRVVERRKGQNENRDQA